MKIADTTKCMIILLICLTCLILAAVIHDLFLIIFGLAAVGICSYVHQYAVKIRLKEEIRLKELWEQDQRESSLKTQRELMWNEFLYYIERR